MRRDVSIEERTRSLTKTEFGVLYVGGDMHDFLSRQSIEVIST
jgi:hypothetical protein